jgi:hypothetical protein
MIMNSMFSLDILHSVSFIGQTFYAYRLYVLSKRRQIPLGIVLVSARSSRLDDLSVGLTQISLASTVAAILTGIFSFEGLFKNVFILNGTLEYLPSSRKCISPAESSKF